MYICNFKMVYHQADLRQEKNIYAQLMPHKFRTAHRAGMKDNCKQASNLNKACCDIPLWYKICKGSESAPAAVLIYSSKLEVHIGQVVPAFAPCHSSDKIYKTCQSVERQYLSTRRYSHHFKLQILYSSTEFLNLRTVALHAF